ncbi:MAG: hypothetical protein LC663_00475 [Actinobacteria bacterium]|nr:hypothetical protein [Actinomycetota bacterium]
MLAVLTFVATACASGKDTGFPAPSPATSSSAPANACAGVSDTATAYAGPIDLAAGNCFAPKVVTVSVGEKIDWKQTDTSAPHTVTSATGGLFDSSPACPTDQTKCMAGGDTFSFKGFTKPGTYIYYCKIHGTPTGAGMAGKIIVK